MQDARYIPLASHSCGPDSRSSLVYKGMGGEGAVGTTAAVDRLTEKYWYSARRYSHVLKRGLVDTSVEGLINLPKVAFPPRCIRVNLQSIAISGPGSTRDGIAQALACYAHRCWPAIAPDTQYLCLQPGTSARLPFS